MTMDAVQIFNDELQSLLDIKPPVSKAKMGQITRAAMKGVKFYKHIVLCVEKFIAKCRPEYKVPGLYVIDSIVRQSRHQFGIERDVYAVRFSRNLQITFENLFTGCLSEDRSKIVRVLNLWQKNGVFSSQTIQPLMDMASGDSGSSLDQANFSATSPPPHENSSKSGQSSNYHYNSSSGRHQKSNSDEVGLKFSKNMLDFDYDEDDDDNGDETPTEAEPPLSSTLNKIGIEQRGHQRSSGAGDGGGNTTYQTSQLQHHNPQYQPDPVLERWNRIIRGESTNDINDSRTRGSRSRSRSPSTQQALQSTSTTRFSSQSNNANTRDFAYKPPIQPKIDNFQVTQRKQVTATIDPERAAEREKKCLPKIRDKHLTVCSSTLWLGHVPKMVSEADLSDAFGEYGTITSIDLIPPRGCAYVCMDRRQDAKRALNESKDLKLNGSHIKMAWAPGKGFKEYRKLKEFWEVETGSSYIPYSKIDETIDFDVLEEGGVIDEDSMSIEMRERRERKQKEKEQEKQAQNETIQNTTTTLPMPALPLMSQPPPPTSIAPFVIPPTNLSIPPPSALTQGMIHFPPPSVPIVTSTASGPVITAPTFAMNNDEQPKEAEDHSGSSPPSIDQQLNMTERQISMVEQQLNMIKQAQNMVGPNNISQTNAMSSIHQQAIPQQQQQPAPLPHIFHPQNQPDPMIFDVPLTQAHLLPTTGQPMLDPSIFVNPAHLMLPISQANMIDPANLHNTMMHHQQRF